MENIETYINFTLEREYREYLKKTILEDIESSKDKNALILRLCRNLKYKENSADPVKVFKEQALAKATRDALLEVMTKNIKGLSDFCSESTIEIVKFITSS